MWTHPAVKQFQLSVSSPDANKYPSAPLHETRLCLRSLLSKHFLPTRAIYRFLPWSGMVSLSLFLSASLSLFFYLKNRTSQLCPAVISQQGNHNCCSSFSSSSRYSFTLTTLMCFETLLCPSMRTS